MRSCLPVVAAVLSLSSAQPALGQAGEPSGFVGAARCIKCHLPETNGWRHSLHAHFMRTWPAEQSAPMLNWKTMPAAPFDVKQAAYLMGNMYKVVFLRATPDGHTFFPHQLDIKTRSWERFDSSVWAAPVSGGTTTPGNTWEELCAGCHVTGFEPSSGKFVEAGITCESCHGPGRLHSATKLRGDIVNPAALPRDRASDVCGSCHSHGTDLKTGRPYPVGFTAGDDLESTFALAPPAPGTNTEVFWGNGAARQHHAQYNEFRASVHYEKETRCFNCHQIHLAREEAPAPKVRLVANMDRFLLKKRAQFACMTCHTDRAVTTAVTAERKVVDAHTRHPALIARPMTAYKSGEAPGTKISAMLCQDCHILRTMGKGYEVASHLFRKPAPHDTVTHGIPNACNQCHDREDPAWAERKIDEWRRLRAPAGQ